MRKILPIFLLLTLSFQLSTASAKTINTFGFSLNELKSSTVDVFVELSGFCASEFIPENYTSTHSITLDNSLEVVQSSILNSVNKFIGCNKELIEQVYQRFGLLMRGFACKVKIENLDKLASTSGVTKVYKAPLYQTMLDLSTEVIGAKQAWTMKDSKGQFVTGLGTTIGVIDTGLDYRHPDLGGKFGGKNKVVEGQDFADGGDIANDPQTHGTHVAGICAANGKVKGVAPDAKLIGFKVFPSDENKSVNVGANVTAAIERALILKCTVVNLSLGSPGGETGSEEANTIYNKATKSGLVVVAAAGNNGARSNRVPFVVGSPSTYATVLSVAATDDTKHSEVIITQPENVRASISTKNFDISVPWPDGEYELVECGFGRQEDFAGKDLKGKVALIQRGPKTDNAVYFRDKNLNAAASGAIGCIIYNHTPGPFTGNMIVDQGDDKKEFIPAVAITLSDGLRLKSLPLNLVRVKVTMGEPFGQIADFSSSGPSADLQFKPEVSAPGVNIYSTLFTEENKETKERLPRWGRMNGTSMACPHVTGAVALLKQYNPKADPKMVKAMFMATADLIFNNESGEYVALESQGSGRINIPAALTCPAVFEPPAGALKTEDNITRASFKIHNLTKRAAIYDLSYYSLGNTTKAQFKTDKVTLKPLGSEVFEIEITCDPESSGIMEGVVFATSGSNKVHLPMIIVQKTGGVPEQVSEIKVNNPVLTLGSETESSTVITFRINFGAYQPGTPGRDVVNNYGVAKVVLYDKVLNIPLGTILYDDTLEVGYHNVKWDGFDNQGRLFISDGEYNINGIGIFVSTSAGSSAYSQEIEQVKPVVTPITVRGSPLPEVPALRMKVVPDTPRMGEPFKIIAYTTKVKGLKSASLKLKFDKISLNLDKIYEEKLFGGKFKDNPHNIFIDNEVGVGLIEIREAEQVSEDLEGVCAIFSCNPMQSGKTYLSYTDVTFDTSFGPIAMVTTGTLIDIVEYYSFYDINNDGIVDELDYEKLFDNLGKRLGDEGYNVLFDLDGNDVIDYEDLFELANRYGQTMYPP